MTVCSNKLLFSLGFVDIHEKHLKILTMTQTLKGFKPVFCTKEFSGVFGVIEAPETVGLSVGVVRNGFSLASVHWSFVAILVDLFQKCFHAEKFQNRQKPLKRGPWAFFQMGQQTAGCTWFLSGFVSCNYTCSKGKVWQKLSE